MCTLDIYVPKGNFEKHLNNDFLTLLQLYNLDYF